MLVSVVRDTSCCPSQQVLISADVSLHIVP
jgi:hypothetical protein